MQQQQCPLEAIKLFMWVQCNVVLFVSTHLGGGGGESRLLYLGGVRGLLAGGGLRLLAL